MFDTSAGNSRSALRPDTVLAPGEAACNYPSIARDILELDSDRAAADTVAAAFGFDTVAVDTEAVADFDKAVVDIEAVAGFDNCLDTASVVEAAIEQGQYPKRGHIAALLVEAMAIYWLEPEQVPIEQAITPIKKILKVCLKYLASWLITYPFLGKISLPDCLYYPHFG